VTSIFGHFLMEGGLRQIRSKAKRPAGRTRIQKRWITSAVAESWPLVQTVRVWGRFPIWRNPTHFAGLKYGMIWTEGATRLDSLPPTGAFYCVLAPKHSGGATSESRAFAVVGDPLARQLIESARKKKVMTCR
jgi:hypothetical protein